MNHLHKLIICFLSIYFLFMGESLQAREDGVFSKEQKEHTVEALAARLMPGHADSFRFKIKEKGNTNYYKVSRSGARILIEGNSPVSVASGLHRYMREYLHVEVSWTNLNPAIPETLPLPRKSIYEESRYQFVTYMNYCTFGYSTVYWDWDRWEKELDWMALHGVTHPLAMVGVEVVWRNFLKKIGYSDKEIRQFLTGPAYMPWLLMGNMETLGGPMTEEWLVRQQRLQDKIVSRMRALGMEPIFQGFYGMVPASFKQKYPQAFVVEQGNWNSFLRPDILSPLDPAFTKLASLWYREYASLYGQAHYFGGDLFHEGGKSGSLDVTACARAVSKSMQEANPRSVWVLQSWGTNPTDALLEGLEPQHAVVVELCAEYWHRWQDRKGYKGIPWVWSNISNWGGNIGLHGRLDAIATQPLSAQEDSDASPTLIGIGFTPEGIETNPVVPSLWSERVWNSRPIDLRNWLHQYAYNRYQVDLPSLKKAWEGFYETAYGTFPGSRRPSEPVFCANPSLDVKTVSAWSQCKIFYDAVRFAQACSDFLKDSDRLKENPNYQYDAVDMVRQYLSDLGRAAYADIQQAWKQKDRTAFDHSVARFLQLIRDQDELLLSHPSFCLKTWLDGARKASIDTGTKVQYEFYNRLMVTSWDMAEGSLNDYAHRELGGLLGTYYYRRWKIYLDYLDLSWSSPDLPPPYIYGLTQTWRYQDIEKEIQYTTDKNPVEVAIEKFKTYYQ